MRANLHSVMNDTKWRELIIGMRQLQDRGFIIQHHAKDIDGPWPSPSGWDGEWFYHLRPWWRLEWLEIRCDERNGAPYKAPVQLSADERDSIGSQIRSWLSSHNIPFSVEAGVIRVWGYTRPGSAPQWCHEFNKAMQTDAASRRG